MILRYLQGDITTQAVDAIVNAANEWMLGGGGVDGAIHEAAGPGLVEECARLPELRPGVRCETGNAVMTGAYNLPARFVIHAVGPRGTDPNASALLESAFHASLRMASDRLEIRSLALPAISCGVFRFPVAKAAAIAVRAAADPWNLDEIRFVLFDESTLDTFRRAAATQEPPAD
ncbi:MAG: macro domain-containing protein [Myxococcota bacterium]